MHFKARSRICHLTSTGKHLKMEGMSDLIPKGFILVQIANAASSEAVVTSLLLERNKSVSTRASVGSKRAGGRQNRRFDERVCGVHEAKGWRGLNVSREK
eukprot:scaffold1720_cov76-Amphora_coffeaeformis.AAC.1